MKIKEGYGLNIGLSNDDHIHLEQSGSVILLTAYEARLLAKELQRLVKEGHGGLVDGDDQ